METDLTLDELPPLSLYVHLPWCVRKCPYCDFNSYTMGDDAPRERYLEFLGSGGSDYPLAVLRRAGVDLETATPYDAAMNEVERNLDELEQLLG